MTDTSFDFDREALTAAINEACAGEHPVCNLDAPCPECKALAQAIKNRLIRAFNAGRLSMSKQEDGNE